MKKALLTGLAALPLLLSAQTIYFEDDFEAYVPDTFLCTQTTDWQTWDNMPGTSTDVMVSAANAAMGVQSVLIVGGSGGGPQDLVLPLGDQTSGQWSAQFYIFVSPVNGGYFNFQKTADPGTEWAMDVFFNDDGSGYIVQNDIEFAFSYTNGSWVHVDVRIDLDTDQASCSIEGVIVHSWQWTIDNQGDPGLNQLGGINFYGLADAGAAMYYIDEVVIYGPDAFATGIEENEEISFDMYPSPVNNILNLSVEDPHDLYINVYDLTGKVVMENVSMLVNSATTSLDVSELKSGVYLLEMTNNKQRFTKRFVKN